jgi:AcrR family transcriptional regulator
MSPAHSATIDLGAVAAVIAERGSGEASAAALARAARVAKPTLYAHFGSLEGVIEACVQHEAEHLLDALVDNEDPGAALAAYSCQAGGWSLVLLDRHPVAVAARTRIAHRIAAERGSPAGLSRNAAAAAFLAAAAAVLSVESPSNWERSLRSLAQALIPVPAVAKP